MTESHQSVFAFLDGIPKCQPERESRAVDYVYGGINMRLRDGNFAGVGMILDGAEVERMHDVVALSLLTSTNPAKGKIGLPRVLYMKRLRDYFRSTRPSEVEALLAGLE